MPNDVKPYFVPSADSVRWGPWMLVDGDDHLPLPASIEGWEPGTDIHLQREVVIDKAAFESETRCALHDCRINVCWRSSTTDMVEGVPPIALPASGTGLIDIELVGARLAGTLNLISRVVLARQTGEDKSIGAARIPGSILAEHKQLLILETPVTMFPLQMVDFARTMYAPDASWHLDVDGQLESPFMGSVLLQINCRDTVLREAISNDGVPDEVQRGLMDELEGGVSALLIDLAIANRDELLDNEWPADSVGDVLKNTLLRADLVDAVPPSVHDLADSRTRVAAAVRRMGQGRLFR